MARRVYLHIGLPKTGTTYLQSTMWHNRALLRTQGMLYPGRQRFDHYYALRQLRHGKADRPSTDGPWNDLCRELAAWPGVGFVSHEFFSVLTRKQAKRVVQDLAPAEVHVIVTVRSYVRQFPAVWQEALKMQVDASFDDFMDDVLADRTDGAWGWLSQDVPAVLARWKPVVPVEHTHVVTVPPPGGPRDVLWKRWCEALELDDTGFDPAVSVPNESLGAPQAALLRRVKPHLSGDLRDPTVRHRWVRRYLGHEVLVPQRGTRFVPRAEHRDLLVRRARHAVRVLRRRGYPVVGDLRDLVAKAADTGAHPDDVTPEEMLEVAARAIEQMVHDVRDLTEERDRWRAAAQHHDRPGPARRLAGRLAGRLPGRHRGRRSPDHEETP